MYDKEKSRMRSIEYVSRQETEGWKRKRNCHKKRSSEEVKRERDSECFEEEKRRVVWALGWSSLRSVLLTFQCCLVKGGEAPHGDFLIQYTEF
jgi:hypothetical protein